MAKQFRPYQLEASRAIVQAWGKHRSCLASLATGAGKTVIAAGVTQYVVQQNKGRVLFLANRNELCIQPLATFADQLGFQPALEKAESCAPLDAKVVIGSVQTLCREKRLKRFPRDHFSFIFADEAHMSMAPSWRRVLDHFEAAKLCGITATPFRADQKCLTDLYETEAFRKDLFHLVDEGYLVNPDNVYKLESAISLAQVRVKKTTEGIDYDLQDAASAIEPYFIEIAREIKEKHAGRKILAFLPLVASSLKFVAACQSVGLNAVHIDGEDPDRDQKLKLFRDGQIDLLSNANLLHTGVDIPVCDCTLNLRPTKSKVLYCLDEQTEVLTPTGWKKDVAIGEPIAGMDANGVIKFVPALATVRRKLEPTEYFVSIVGQSCDIRVTNRHRLLYDNARKLGWKIATAGYVSALKNGVHLPVAGRGAFKGVPLSDDELRFIGWFMTDGSLNKANNAISISQSESQPHFKEIPRMLEACGLKYGTHLYKGQTQFKSSANRYIFTVSKGIPRGRDKHLKGWAHLEPWISKDFADALMNLDERQFGVLLEAIHLGDGAKQLGQPWQRQSYHIATGNKTFAERLQIAGLQRGYRSNVSKDKSRLLWTVHLKKQCYIRVGNRHGQHSRWKKELPNHGERCWCVQNELGTLVTRRNGKVAIVGNCQIIGRSTRTVPGLIDGIETVEGRLAAIAGSAKPRAYILDPLWLTEDHDLVTPSFLIAPDQEFAEEMNRQAGKSYSLRALAAKVQADREEAIRRRLEATARFREGKVSAEFFAACTQEHEIVNYQAVYKWEAAPPTKFSKLLLQQAGIDPDSVASEGLARQVMLAIGRRRYRGLAEIGSLGFFAERAGVSDQLWQITRKEAMGHGYQRH